MVDFNKILREDESKLKEYLQLVREPNDLDPRKIPIEIAANTYWDFMDAKKRDEILFGMFCHVLKRATSTPVYEVIKMPASEIKTRADLLKIPPLTKDGFGNVPGFREQVAERGEQILMPTDVPKENLKAWLSGGTKGKQTPTYLTDWDLEVESAVLARRCFLAGGFEPGESLLTFYNPLHKGGQAIIRAGKMLSMDVYVKSPAGARQNFYDEARKLDVHVLETVEDCLQAVREKKISTIAAVQPEVKKTEEDGRKGISFISLYDKAPELFGKDRIVKCAFITGYQIPEQAQEIISETGMQGSTTWGASEGLPGATSTVGLETRLCKFNKQHITYLPHFVMLANVNQDSNYSLAAAKPGKSGIFLLTTLARKGTPLINYAIGDVAKLNPGKCECGRTSEIIYDIERAIDRASLVGGCAAT